MFFITIHIPHVDSRLRLPRFLQPPAPPPATSPATPAAPSAEPPNVSANALPSNGGQVGAANAH